MVKMVVVFDTSIVLVVMVMLIMLIRLGVYSDMTVIISGDEVDENGR
jgi:hypothetical protein